MQASLMQNCNELPCDIAAAQSLTVLRRLLNACSNIHTQIFRSIRSLLTVITQWLTGDNTLLAILTNGLIKFSVEMTSRLSMKSEYF
jgi:hypothetical protein